MSGIRVCTEISPSPASFHVGQIFQANYQDILFR